MLGLGLLAIVTPRTSHPYLLWNGSPSVPVGLYELVSRPPMRGEMAIIRLADPVHALAVVRGYLAGRALLIKPVVAVPGDVVCRHAATVTVNADVVASARDADALGRYLPQWQGCRTLVAGQVFVLSTAPDSFDGRYFGPLNVAQVLGVGRAIWTR
jgi:conjugative transfer signal peptidase TraF